MITFLQFRAFLIGSIFFLFYCKEKSKEVGIENLYFLLTSNLVNTSTITNCPQQWKFSNVYLANQVLEAPGATGEGFKDKNRAINGICGAGKLGGSLDVYSLQKSSIATYYCKLNEKCIVLEWENKKVQNVPGIDFVVFENPFCKGNESNCNNSRFMEPVVVEVSEDGINWCGWNPQYTGSSSPEDLQNPNFWQRFAGIEPVIFNQENWQLAENDIFDKTKAGGDGFDLSDSNFGSSGDGCNSTVKNQIQTDGFIYLRLTSANSRGFTYPSDSFDQTADIDGVVAKSVTNR